MTTRRRLLGLLLPAASALSPAAPAAFDLHRIDQLFGDLRKDQYADLQGVRILSEGRLVAESYFNGGDPERLHDIRSAGKSITSLLTGIAIDQKLISGVHVPLSHLLPPASRPDLESVTLEDLLTMRSGFSADDEDPASPGNEDRMDASPSWLNFALAVPLREKPGQRYQYSSLNAFLTGVCVENASGKSLDAFARQHLFGPLGIDNFTWRKGPQGRVAGQGNLRITLSAMSALGQMCLNHGRVASTQVVSAQWIERSLSSIVSISHTDPFADWYGYMWYTKTHEVAGRPIRVHFASGNGGNKIYIVPELKTVVAIASVAYGRPYGQRRSQQILLEILGASQSA